MTAGPQTAWGAAPSRRNGWYLGREAGRLVHARQWPPRFDVEAVAAFPAVRRGRLARAVRQDLWRRLRGLRGFAPVVEVVRAGDGLRLRAGGALRGPARPGLEAEIAALLADPAARARWQGYAGGACRRATGAS